MKDKDEKGGIRKATRYQYSMINEGEIIFLDYREIVHMIYCRLGAISIQNDIYMIIIPDYDIYEE